MKKFLCQCGHEVRFEDTQCPKCSMELGFDSQTMSMVAIKPSGQNLFVTPDNRQFKRCQNGTEYGVCNWLIPKQQSHQHYCFGCQFNRTVPNQSGDQQSPNRQRWQRLEQAKKRLLYSLMALNLPLDNGWENPKSGLLFDFIEDTEDLKVTTGYANGIITINSIEADDVARISTKFALNERYRTLIGHLRHESGHYYLSLLKPEANTRHKLERLFGNIFEFDQDSYQQALDSYYQNGPVENWSDQYITAYASSHPLEDWAETWSHYLLIVDTLETAAEQGQIDATIIEQDTATQIAAWRKLAHQLNQLNRSVGREDAYPFTISANVEEKIAAIGLAVDTLNTIQPKTAVGC